MGLFGDDIHLCPSGGDVLLCPDRDIELCTDCPTLTLSGTDEPIVGSIYTASGGAGDLTFTMIHGTIVATSPTTAKVTSVDACDPVWGGGYPTATIKVVDSCGDGAQSAEIIGRLANGNWSTKQNGSFCGASCTSPQTVYVGNLCYALESPGVTSEVIIGAFKYEITGRSFYSGDHADKYGTSLKLPYHGLGTAATCSDNGNSAYPSSFFIYEWVC